MSAAKEGQRMIYGVFRKVDPMVELNLEGHETTKTKVVIKNRNPVWHHRVHVPINCHDYDNREFIFQLKDYTMLKPFFTNEYMGFTAVSVARAVDECMQGNREYWFSVAQAGFFLYTVAKTQIIEMPKLRSTFRQNSVQFFQNSDFTTL